MVLPFETLSLKSSAKQKLVEKLQAQSEVMSFTQNEVLASLCTCIGLEYELGRKNYDRLSPFFGVEPVETGENPWHARIFSQGEKIGLELQRRDGQPLQVRHPDFLHIIDPQSFNHAGELSRIVIFPSDVARIYKTFGLELVIVRDWLLTSALSLDESKKVPYLYTNPWEIENNVALTQAKIVAHCQLALSGTHDIVDHLLGADVSKFKRRLGLFREVEAVLNYVFQNGRSRTRGPLMISYLLGVLLDDMAQPKWYDSRFHEILTSWALQSLLLFEAPNPETLSFDVPNAFNSLIGILRSPDVTEALLETSYRTFLAHLSNPTQQ